MSHRRPPAPARPAGRRSAARPPALLALALLLLASAGCERLRSLGRGDLPRATRGYVVISIDTLRADHLGLYGYPRPTSPFLDGLAGRATVFDEAYAAYPSTLTSHMTMFTGLHPREHGVYPPQGVLAKDIETFPEVFRRAGYRTFAVTEGGFVSPRFGFKRGFETFLVRDRNGERKIEGTFDKARGFLAGLGRREKFLLFVHTYAVHAPYDAPAEFERPFWSGPPPPDAVEPSATELTRVSERGDRLSPAARAWLGARYDAGIRETDGVLQRFFAGLEALGLADDTTVIVTSDHGEELQEHGRLHHSQLYREVMHVPLLVLHPDRRQPVRQGGIVGLHDLAPTLYELAGLEPSQPVSGHSLASLLGRPQAAPAIATAWTETSDGSRALYRGVHGDVTSLHAFDPPQDAWVNRHTAFDVSGGEIAFEARAYQGLRKLVVRSERDLLGELAVTPEWTPIRLRLPPGPGRVHVEADDCTEEGAGRKFTCRAFQLRGVSRARLELYDVDADPGQVRDLAAERPRDARRLLRDLLAFRPKPRGATSEAPLDPELQKRLEALGYLN